MLSPTLTRILGLILVSLLLSACQSQTTSDFDRISAGMQVSMVETDTHQHLIVRSMSQNSTQKTEPRLHVYLDGDGLPWIKRYFVARDPTPRHVFMLEMMRQDQLADTLYLGRPCYFNEPRYGLNDANCHPSLWTSRRYSDEVVSSMTQALRKAVNLAQYQQLVIIGHSGGGTLAVLIGLRLQEEIDVQVITLAANLDTDAWTRHHGYSPLFGSLNPAEVLPQAQVAMSQVHWAGGRDKVVPPALNAPFLETLGYPLRVIDDYNHGCCWERDWPDILRQSLVPGSLEPRRSH